jgi:integrase
MKGSIRKRGSGWQITIWTGQKPDGSPARYYEAVKGTKADAQRRCRELLGSMDRGIPIPTGRLTVEQHLNQWLSGYVKTKCCQRTQDGYTTVVRVHLIPNLGHIQLRQLQPQAIQAYYGRASEKLSGRTLLHHHRVLSQALKWGVRQGYLGRNPCDLVDAPRARKTIMRNLTPPEVEAMLEKAQGNRYYPVIYTAVSTGLRQGELLGLRWRDVDLEGLTISVSQVLYKRRCVCIFKQPKTSGSSRRVSMTPKLACYLREYRREREVLYLDLGTVLSLDDLVFADVDGKPLDPSVLTHNFGKIVKQAGLPRVRFHDLRHTFASLALLRGAKPKVISEALGHSSVAFTMDTYSHIMSGMQEDMMALLDEVLPSGIPASRERQDDPVHD